MAKVSVVRHVKRAIHHPSRKKLVAYQAAQCGVTPEHYLSIVAKRKAYRLARMYRRRARKRAMERTPRPRYFQKKQPHLPMAGQGDLNAMMLVVGLGTSEFCRIAGFPRQQFTQWYGHCMYGWPVEFLRYYGWAQNMAAHLKSQGVDPEKFKPQLPTGVRAAGKYPRKKGDVVIRKEDYSPFNALDKP